VRRVTEGLVGGVGEAGQLENVAEMDLDLRWADHLASPADGVLEEVRQHVAGDAFVGVVAGDERDSSGLGVTDAFDDRGQDAGQFGSDE
jgi:hypothetical protein